MNRRIFENSNNRQGLSVLLPDNWGVSVQIGLVDSSSELSNKYRTTKIGNKRHRE